MYHWKAYSYFGKPENLISILKITDCQKSHEVKRRRSFSQGLAALKVSQDKLQTSAGKVKPNQILQNVSFFRYYFILFSGIPQHLVLKK